MKNFRLLYTFLCLALVQTLYSQTTGDYRTAQTSVTFSSAAHWQTWNGTQWTTASGVPASSNDIYIQAGHTVTLASNQNCNNLFISTGTTNATTGGDGQVILQGNILSVNGKLSCYFGAVNISNGSGTALALTATATTPSAPITKTSGGVLKFVGNTRNLTVSNEWGAGATGNNALFDVEFALNSGETGSLVSVLKAANWVFSSGTINCLGRIAVDNGTTGQGDVTIQSDATLISGESGSGATPVISRTTSTICGNVIINGILKLTGSSPHIQCKAYTIGSNSKVEYARAGSQTFLASSYSSASDLLIYKNIVLSGSGNKTTLASINTELSADGSLFIYGGSLVVGSSGNFTVSSTATTLVYCGSSAQTAAAGEWNTNFKNVTINNSAGVSLGFSRSINGSLFLVSGTFANGSNLSFAAGTAIQKSAGILGSVPTFGSGVNIIYEQSGSLITSGNELPSNTSVLTDLNINNSNGVKLSSAVTVNGNLSLNQGNLISSSTHLLTMANGSTTSSSGSASSFVSGPMKKIGNSDFIFPIGKGNKWARAAISNISGGSKDFFVAEYFDNSPSNLTSLGSGLSSGRVSHKEYWIIDPNTAMSGNLTLYWEDGNFSGIAYLSSSDLVVAHYLSGNWISEDNTFSSGSSSSGLVTSATISSWSPFTFGSPSLNNPLPVKLVDFVSSANSSLTSLAWKTMSEINNQGFNIQKSIDGKHFTEIGFEYSKAEAGFSSQSLLYSFTDPSPNQVIAYYRLKQIDYDGKFEYSPIVACILSPQDNSTWIYRNQTLQFDAVREKENTITILDFMGRTLESKKLDESLILEVSHLQTGIYYVRLNSQKARKLFVH